MTTKNLLLCAIVFMAFSCTNEEDIFNINRNLSSEEELKTKSFSDSIPIVNNYKDLFTVFGVEIDNNQQNINSISLLSDPILKTVKGYSSMVKKDDNKKVRFGNDLAKQLGLIPGTIYVTTWYICEKQVSYPNNQTFFANDKSLKCGLLPYYNNYNEEETDFNLRGYRIVGSENPITLRTHLFYVYCDISGRTINKFIPCTPENIEWDYYLF